MATSRKQLVIISAVCAAVFAAHAIYFRTAGDTCEYANWVQGYIAGREYFAGLSYALSVSFMVFAFLKFKENKKAALTAAMGGGLWAVVLWFLCFLSGCCGSPMLLVWLNLLGLAGLQIPKFAMLLMTIVFVGISYAWLARKSRVNCCGGKPCKEDKI